MEWYEWTAVIAFIVVWPVGIGLLVLWLARRTARRGVEQVEAERAAAALRRRNGYLDRGRVTGRRPEHVDEQPGRNGRMRVYGTRTLPGDAPATRK